MAEAEAETETETETLGILDEIEALVSDKLQVVSYKWLSRNFLLSSNAAKRLLKDFVEKHKAGFEALYALSGRLKNNSSEYHIKLVPGHKLTEAKQEFDDNCSVQVYSVQACLPKDPVLLWNAEFVQAEELFKQPPNVDNCLRDNRFCGISNSFVKWNADGAPTRILASQFRKAVVPGPCTSNSAKKRSIPLQSTPRKSHESSPKIVSDTGMVKDTKTESCTIEGGHEQAGKPPSNKEKAPQLPSEKKKDQNNKITSGNGGSLANMWGRASAKTKPSSITAETNDSVSKSSAADAHEAADDANTDEDGHDVNFKRASNGDSGRKRRAIFYFSDDEDEYNDAVNLASPDLPKGKTFLDPEQDTKTSLPEKSKLDFDEEKNIRSNVKEEKVPDKKSVNPPTLGPSVVKSGKPRENASSDKMQNHIPEISSNTKDKGTDAAPSSPKRRKVLKARIDERGREVTEVVWEGDDGEARDDVNTSMKADSKTVSTTGDRPAVANKSRAVGCTASSNASVKAGQKKGGNLKDPKQGNILSFFKRV